MKISPLLDKLDRFLKKENNLHQKIYKMSSIRLLWLYPFRNCMQNSENIHISVGNWTNRKREKTRVWLSIEHDHLPCQSICPSIGSFSRPCVHLSLRPFIYLSILDPFCPFIFSQTKTPLCLGPSISLSVCTTAFLSVCPSVFLYVCLSVCLFVCLPVCIDIFCWMYWAHEIKDV